MCVIYRGQFRCEELSQVCFLTMKKGHILSACLAAVAGIVLGFQPAKEPQIVAQAEVPKSSHAPSKVPDCLCPSGTPRAKGFQPTGLMAFQGVPAEISAEQRFQLWKEHALEEMASLGVPAGSLHQSFPTLLSYVKDGKQIEYRMDSSAKLIGLRNGTVEVQYHVPDRPYGGFALKAPLVGYHTFTDIITTTRDVQGRILSATFEPTGEVFYTTNGVEPTHAENFMVGRRMVQLQQNDFLDAHWGPAWAGKPNPFANRNDCLAVSDILYKTELLAASEKYQECMQESAASLASCLGTAVTAGAISGAAALGFLGSVVPAIGTVGGAVGGFFIGGSVAAYACLRASYAHEAICEQARVTRMNTALSDKQARTEFCLQLSQAQERLE